MSEFPAGTVTFLFTDIECSTRLLQRLGPEAYADALAEHRRILRAAFTAEGGVEVDTQGDAFFVASPTAPGAPARYRSPRYPDNDFNGYRAGQNLAAGRQLRKKPPSDRPESGAARSTNRTGLGGSPFWNGAAGDVDCARSTVHSPPGGHGPRCPPRSTDRTSCGHGPPREGAMIKVSLLR